MAVLCGEHRLPLFPGIPTQTDERIQIGQDRYLFADWSVLPTKQTSGDTGGLSVW